MTKSYITYRSTSLEALDHLDEFIDKMNEFVKKHPYYTYDSLVEKVEDGWAITVNVIKDEQIKISTT